MFLVIILAQIVACNAGTLPFSSSHNCKRPVTSEENLSESILKLDRSSFTCTGRYDGYYADTELDCKIFHYCQTWYFPSGLLETVRWDFLCPQTTIFNQLLLTCTPPSNIFKCQQSPNYYGINLIFSNFSTTQNHTKPHKEATPINVNSSEKPANVYEKHPLLSGQKETTYLNITTQGETLFTKNPSIGDSNLTLINVTTTIAPSAHGIPTNKTSMISSSMFPTFNSTTLNNIMATNTNTMQIISTEAHLTNLNFDHMTSTALPTETTSSLSTLINDDYNNLSFVTDPPTNSFDGIPTSQNITSNNMTLTDTIAINYTSFNLTNFVTPTLINSSFDYIPLNISITTTESSTESYLTYIPLNDSNLTTLKSPFAIMHLPINSTASPIVSLTANEVILYNYTLSNTSADDKTSDAILSTNPDKITTDSYLNFNYITSVFSTTDNTQTLPTSSDVKMTTLLPPIDFTMLHIDIMSTIMPFTAMPSLNHNLTDERNITPSVKGSNKMSD